MTTITHNAGTITPDVVDGYEASRPVNTIVHTILNRSNPDVTFRAPGLRTGTLTCVFGDRLQAVSAFGVFGVPQVLTLADTDVPSVGMLFVVAPGDLTIALDDETRSVWLVTVPFQEVLS